MDRTQRLRLVALAATASLLATATYVPTAFGADRSDAASRASETGIASATAPVQTSKQRSARTYSAQEARKVEAQGGDPAVLDYWTPERMASAKPLDAPGDRQLVTTMAQEMAQKMATTPVTGQAGALQSAPADDTARPGEIVTRPVEPAGKADDQAESGASSGEVGTQAIRRFPITTGKLFMGGYGSSSYCSASSLNTRSKRVVITAGHCVHTGKGGHWRKNLVFVPAYNKNANRQAPYGLFQAATLHTFTAWIKRGGTTRGWGRDVGMVTTYANANQKRVVKAVGGNGLRISKYYSWPATIFGYPSNRSGGNVMWGCQNTVHKARSVPHASTIVGCGFGGGSSGGPWLWKYKSSNRLGYTRGVTSYGPNNNAYLGAPHFDPAVRKLAVRANNAF